MTKIGGIRRDGLLTRKLSGATSHVIFEIGKRRYLDGGRALVA
jgi:N-acetyltransferase